MAESTDLPLDDDDQLVDPPLVDLLRRDHQRNAWVITFVPSDDVSTEPTEVVTIAADSSDARRIDALLARALELLAPGRSLDKVVHGGGGNYTFWLDHGESRELAHADSPAITQEITDRLKQVAETAESIFRRVAVRP